MPVEWDIEVETKTTLHVAADSEGEAYAKARNLLGDILHSSPYVCNVEQGTAEIMAAVFIKEGVRDD